MKLGKHHGLKKVIVESDCQVVINRLSKHVVFLSNLNFILSDILSSVVFFLYFWSHVKRDDNHLVNHLVKLDPFGIEQVWENHCLPKVAPYLFLDMLVLS